MYSLYPSHALRAVRAEFADYEVFELHDHNGRAEYTAVLKEPYRDTDSAVLVSAGTVGELVAELRDQGSPPLRLVPAPRAAPRRGGGPVEDALTERLRDRIYELRDRGLLPRWRPGPEVPPQARVAESEK